MDTDTLEEVWKVFIKTLAMFMQSARETHWGSSESIQMQNYTRTQTHINTQRTYTVFTPAHTLNSLSHSYDYDLHDR